MTEVRHPRGLTALLGLAVAALGMAACVATSQTAVRRADTTEQRVASTVEPGPSTPLAPIDQPSGLELVFNETFDGPELSDVWSTCYWWQVDGGCTIGSNDEQQWYRPEGVDVDDGFLRLTLSDDRQRTADGDELPHRSGMVSTGHVDDDVAEPGFAFTYGIVETRVRFPDGAGTWPAVWLLSADRTSLPEIDLMEWYGSEPRTVTGHVHQRVDGERASARVETTSPSSLAGQWHDVALDWTSTRVVFYFDGVEVGRVDDTALVPESPLYLIVNLAARGPAGEVDRDALPQELLVDWVRVWQRPDEQQAAT